MKTSYRQNNRPRLWLIVATACIALLIGIDVLASGAIRNTIRGGIATVWVGAHSVGNTIDRSGALSSKRSLAEENARLTAELESLRNLQIENRLLIAENASLRSLARAPGEGEAVAARVLSSPSASPYDSIVIGAGSEQGVSVGDHVLLSGGIALGTVSEVSARSSLVGLYFAAGRTTPAIIGGTAAVTVTGRGGSNGSVLVPRSVPVATGDLVYLAGSPYALGVVGSVEAVATDARSTVYIALPMSIAEARFVQVVPALPVEMHSPSEL
jgi:rod shape-determining protein MreC